MVNEVVRGGGCDLGGGGGMAVVKKGGWEVGWRGWGGGLRYGGHGAGDKETSCWRRERTSGVMVRQFKRKV